MDLAIENTTVAIRVVLLLLLLLACLQDVRSRFISGWVVVSSMLVALALFTLQSGPFEMLLLSIVVLILGVVASRLNVLGGADSKLLAALVLVINPAHWSLYLLGFMVVTAFTVLSVVLLRYIEQDAGLARIPLIPAIVLPAVLLNLMYTLG
ncbi:hypothetical protein NF212_11450 [Parasalinivibrio latis]|uniref:prepilin peptidase n=1 Tax=Parasalinivibrio latis TaxID=2952610 RepID=UPI0030DF5F73